MAGTSDKRKENKMTQIRVDKLTINIGVGKTQDRLEKAMKLITHLTNGKPVQTVTQKRLAAWGLRPGLPIGCKITLRKQKAVDMLKRLLEAKDYKLKTKQFDNNGNIAFGLHEYIEIPSAKYDPSIGNMGLEACVTLGRPGFRIARRKQKTKKIPRKIRITQKESIEFMEKNFNVKIIDKQVI